MVRLIVLVVCCFAACNSLKTANSENDHVSPNNSQPAAINCGDPTSYDVTVVDGPIRAVNIVAGDKRLRTIDVPAKSEVPGFSLSWARKTKEGFDLSVEYGSTFYYGKRFEFACKSNDLVLTGIAVETFDRNNPSKWTKKQVSIKPTVPVGRFKITDYLKEEETR